MQMAPKVETSPLAVGFASKLAPTGHFFGVEHILIPSKLMGERLRSQR